MSATITLQAALVVNVYPAGSSVKYQISIPSGTVLTFPNAVATGDFNQALDAVADTLYTISPTAFKDNLSQLNRNSTVNSIVYQVTYGPAAQAIYTSYNNSPSASASASPSASASASPSASPSTSASNSPSRSASASPSASPSASSSVSASASPS